MTNVYYSFQERHHVIRISDRYWCVLLTDIIIVDVLMEDLLRVDGKQGYERGP